MPYNGPTIKEGCVTRRNSGRALIPVLWQKISFDRKRRVWFTFCRLLQVLLSITCVAVQTVSEPEICQGAGFKLHADEGVRVKRLLRICLGCSCKSKKCDKQLTFTVHVIGRYFYLSSKRIWISFGVSPRS